MNVARAGVRRRTRNYQPQGKLNAYGRLAQKTSSLLSQKDDLFGQQGYLVSENGKLKKHYRKMKVYEPL